MLSMLWASRAARSSQRWRPGAALLLIALLCTLLPALPAAAADLPAPAQQGGEPVTALDEVENAVIQIEAEGAFVDPIEGAMVSGGYGSGFIIDPQGIAVTNNHVVTGGALFRVYVAGRSRPVNARVLGVAECADLAVIDLDGSGYDYLTWYDGPIRVGLDVYAAGFPLGDPEFTLTRGIVAKARADGESSWASIDGVIQHDATINPATPAGRWWTPTARWWRSTMPATTTQCSTSPSAATPPRRSWSGWPAARTWTRWASTARRTWTRKPK